MNEKKLTAMIEENNELLKTFIEAYDSYVIDKKIDHANITSVKERFFEKSVKKLGGILSEMGVIITDEHLKKFILEWGQNKFKSF